MRRYEIDFSAMTIAVYEDDKLIKEIDYAEEEITEQDASTSFMGDADVQKDDKSPEQTASNIVRRDKEQGKARTTSPTSKNGDRPISAKIP